MIFSDTNILLFLLAVIPGILYPFIIFLFSPSRSISIKKSFTCLFFGSMSAIAVIKFSDLFPNFHNYIFLERINIDNFSISGGPSILSYFFKAFFQVALIEELSKFFVFYALWHFINNSRDKNNPFSIAFYCMLVSISFGIYENILYGMRFGVDILPLRSITALMLHMSVGIFMGYFIALGSLKDKYPHGFTYWFGNRKIERKYLYNTIAILSAFIYHGLYDVNLFLPNNKYKDFLLFYTVYLGLHISYKMLKKLSRIPETK